MNPPAQPFGRRSSSVFLAVALWFFAVSAAHAAPLPAVAAFAGEWTGKAATPAASEMENTVSPDARRYWIEGDVVRGEIISWGDSMQTFHVAILPRASRFLKILTPEGGEPEYFVGHAAHGGVLWTSVDSDQTRYLERVAGAGDEKRFELLSPEIEDKAEVWQVTASLKTAKSALTSVIGDVLLEPKLIEPVVYPTPQELEFFDRVSELVQQRDEARQNNAGLVRELAGAWQELGQPAPADAARAVAPAARLASLEAQLRETQQWSAGLEESLAAANARADEAAARAQSLEVELTGLRASSTAGAGTAEAARAEAARLEERLASLAKEVEDAADSRSDLVEELQGARAQLIALTKEKTDLETRVAEADAQAEQTRVLQAELSAAQAAGTATRAEVENLLERLADLQNDNSRLEAALAAAEQASSNTAIAAALEETRNSLAAATAENTVSRATIEDLREQVGQAGDTRARLEQELKDAALTLQTANKDHAERFTAVNRMRDSAMNDLTAANERGAMLQSRVAELEQSSKLTAGELAAAREQIAALESRMSAALVENKTMEKELREARQTPPAVADLDARLARAVEVSAQSVAALSDAEDEIATLTKNLEKITDEKAELAEQLKIAQAKPDVDPATAARLAATDEELADARRQIESVREELARAVSAREEIEGRLAEAGRSAETRAAAVGDLEARVAHLEAEAVSAIELRLALEREKNTTAAELALAKNAAAELEQQIAGQRETLAVGGQRAGQVEADLAAAREHIRVLEGQVAEAGARAGTLEEANTALEARLAQSLAAPPEEDRIGELETRLAETFSRAEARQTENDQLRIRLASLEADRQRLRQQLEERVPVASIPASEADALRRELADAESGLRAAEARNADLMARLSDVEVSLAAASVGPRPRASAPAIASPVPSSRAVASSPTPARTAPPAAAPLFVSSAPPSVSSPASGQPASPPAGAAEGRVQFRMPAAAASVTAPVRQPPTRPAEPASFFVASAELSRASSPPAPDLRAGSDFLVAQAVRTFVVNGFRRAGSNSMVVIGGTPFRAGDVVDPTRGVRFVRIDPNALVFADPDGGEYRRPL